MVILCFRTLDRPGELLALRPRVERALAARLRAPLHGAWPLARAGRAALWGLMIALVMAPAARADEGPSATPYRPSVSTPAALSAPGWLEVEAGWQHDRADDPVRRDSLPYSLKLAFTPDWGVRVGGIGWLRETDADGTRRSGGGDTAIVLKRRFGLDLASAFGVELGASIPTARSGLGSGHRDVGINGIYSSDFGDAWHTDLNLNLTRLGGADEGASRWQQGWAAALSRSLDGPWGLTAELSGTRQRGADSTAQVLVSASYALSRRLVLDAGASRGLNRATSDWSAFTGLTFLAFNVF